MHAEIQSVKLVSNKPGKQNSLTSIFIPDQTFVPRHGCPDSQRVQGERRLERHRPEDAERCFGARQTVQGLRHEKVSAKHEQRAQEADSGSK